MDEEKVEPSGGGGGGGDGDAKKAMSPSHEEALKKCLEENKGDRNKCESLVESFKSSSSSSSSVPQKPLTPLRLKSGSLTDV
ncbi:hypothetical protein L1049_018855 [Liquidambar formosana]|uniref:Uncharacterized protein n=1 Tax=Liquidambar formosana TaxID=63359 RepID=A0AAP0RAN3_LIQFO